MRGKNICGLKIGIVGMFIGIIVWVKSWIGIWVICLKMYFYVEK